MFDLPSGRQVAALPLTDRATTPVAFLPDGRLLTSGVAEVDVWRLDAAASPLGRTLRGHDGRVAGAFVPGSSAGAHEIVTQGIDDRRVLLWDAATGRARGAAARRRRRTPPSRSAPTAPCSPRRDATATVRLWDRAGKTELAPLAAGRGDGWPAATPGRRGASTPSRGARRGGGSRWPPAVRCSSGTSATRHRPRLERRPAVGGGLPHPGAPDELHLAFSHDGRRLAVEDVPGRTVALFDAATGRKVWSQRLDATGPLALAFSPDDATLAVGYGTIAAGVVELPRRADRRTAAAEACRRRAAAGSSSSAAAAS